MKSLCSQQNGFTLIELLTVLVIVSILIGLGLGAFSIASKKARETACLSNLRQVAAALNTYCVDNDGVLPFIGAGNPGTPQWFQEIEPYTGNADPYNPKSILANPLAETVTPYESGSMETFGGKYSRTIAPSTFIQHVRWNYRIANCRDPSKTILVGAMKPAPWSQLATADGYLVGNEGESTWSVGTEPGSPCPYVDEKQRSFVAMVDGHAEILSSTQLNEDSPYWKWW